MGKERFLAELDAVNGEPSPTWKEIEASTRYFWRVAAYPYHLFYRMRRFRPRSMYDAVRPRRPHQVVK